MKKLFRKIKSVFVKVDKSYVVILFDTHKHYISSNIFDSEGKALEWANAYNASSLSIKAVEVVPLYSGIRLIGRI